jgi:uncharacterized protein YndB with AHSA1/START domain
MTLQLTKPPSVETGMLIRRSPHSVFEALADPSITTRFSCSFRTRTRRPTCASPRRASAAMATRRSAVRSARPAASPSCSRQ